MEYSGSSKLVSTFAGFALKAYPQVDPAARVVPAPLPRPLPGNCLAWAFVAVADSWGIVVAVVEVAAVAIAVAVVVDRTASCEAVVASSWCCCPMTRPFGHRLRPSPAGYPCRTLVAVAGLLLALLSQPLRHLGPAGHQSQVYPRGLARPSRAYAVAVVVAADWERMGLHRQVDPDAWVFEARANCRYLNSGSYARSSQPFDAALEQLLVA